MKSKFRNGVKACMSIVMYAVIVMVIISNIMIDAKGYDNSMAVYVDGKQIEGVEVYIDVNNTIWVEDAYKAVKKLFPKETANLWFPEKVEDVTLQKLANDFSYTLTVNDKKAYLVKKGTSTNNGSSNLGGNQNSNNTGSDTNNGSTSITQKITIYVNNNKISNVTAFIDKDKVVWLEDGYKNLQKVFPEAKDEEFPNIVRSVKLSNYAKDYGYSYELKGTNFYLNREEKDSTIKIFVNGMKVLIDAKFDSNGEVSVKQKDLSVIFKEAVNLKLDSLGYSYVNLRKWAMYYQYIYIQNGPRVYISNEKGYRPVEVHLDGKVVQFQDLQPFVKNGRTMIPVRSLSELLGCEVEWLNNKVKLTKNASNNQSKVEIVIYLNSTVYTVNGKEYSTDVAPYIDNNRTVCPIRFFAEAFGMDVAWRNGIVNVVAINSK